MYKNLKDLVIDCINGFGPEYSELKERVQKAYEEDLITGHEYDDLMQYLDD